MSDKDDEKGISANDGVNGPAHRFRISCSNAHDYAIAIIGVSNLVGVMLITLYEWGGNHAKYADIGMAVVGRISSTLIPLTAVILVILEGITMVFARIFWNQEKQLQDEERRRLIEEHRRLLEESNRRIEESSRRIEESNRHMQEHVDKRIDEAIRLGEQRAQNELLQQTLDALVKDVEELKNNRVADTDSANGQ